MRPRLQMTALALVGTMNRGLRRIERTDQFTARIIAARHYEQRGTQAVTRHEARICQQRRSIVASVAPAV